MHAHRLKPRVLVEHIVPTIFTARNEETRKRWLGLIQAYGPKDASDVMREGFRGSAALIAFNYRIPNNTPLFLHQSSSGWRALYTGAAPEDLRPAFGLEPPEQRIDRAAAAIGVELATSFPSLTHKPFSRSAPFAAGGAKAPKPRLPR